MSEFIDSAYGSVILWIIAALVLLILLLIVVKMIRRMNFGTFISGGRNRKTRLAVMDATAIDSHRRLVLVRRDDVEHLILIGGPTDLVVEREIRLAGAKRTEPVMTQAPAPAPQPRPVQPPSQPRISPVAPQRPARVAAPQPQTQAQSQPLPPQPAAKPVEQAQPTPPSANIPAPDQRMQVSEAALDASLANELALSLGDPAPNVAASAPTPDDEMSRLLGELSNTRR
ncbi:hypothetical protein ACFPLB_05780 [Aquamicrobium segne]|uniref:Flagellar biosynthesis protein FliO n=1 Tax=Aquamicrobium segne TaxID=469547 RepID=A0ABW0GYL9_9HYPH